MDESTLIDGNCYTISEPSREFRAMEATADVHNDSALKTIFVCAVPIELGTLAPGVRGSKPLRSAHGAKVPRSISVRTVCTEDDQSLEGNDVCTGLLCS